MNYTPIDHGEAGGRDVSGPGVSSIHLDPSLYYVVERHSKVLEPFSRPTLCHWCQQTSIPRKHSK